MLTRLLHWFGWHGWLTVRRTSCNLYQQCPHCGKRRVVMSGDGYQPIAADWLTEDVEYVRR
jgi:hypothetical protein